MILRGLSSLFTFESTQLWKADNSLGVVDHLHEVMVLLYTCGSRRHTTNATMGSVTLHHLSILSSTQSNNYQLSNKRGLIILLVPPLNAGAEGRLRRNYNSVVGCQITKL